MNVLVGRLELHLPWARSLKEKRMVVRSVRGRLRDRFEVSCSEVALHDLHQRVILGVAAVGPDRVPLEALWEKIVDFTENGQDGELTSHDSDILEFGEEAR